MPRPGERGGVPPVLMYQSVLRVKRAYQSIIAFRDMPVVEQIQILNMLGPHATEFFTPDNYQNRAQKNCAQRGIVFLRRHLQFF